MRQRMQEKHKWHARRDAAAPHLPSLQHSCCGPRGADMPPACPCFTAPPLRVRVPSGKKQKTCRPTGNRIFGTPEGTRTPNPQNRNRPRANARVERKTNNFRCESTKNPQNHRNTLLFSYLFYHTSPLSTSPSFKEKTWFLRDCASKPRPLLKTRDTVSSGNKKAPFTRCRN